MAFQVLGRPIPAVVKDVDDDTARRLAFEENFRRKNFSPVDLAKLFLEARGDKPAANWSERVSKKFGVSRATVTEHVKMYEGLAGDADLLAQVHSGELRADAAILLAKEKGEKRAAQLQEAKRLAEEEAERKAARAKVDKKYNASKKAAGKAGKPPADAGKAVQTPEGGKKSNTDLPAAPATPSRPARVTAKHVRQAARTTGGVKTALSREELLAGIGKLVTPNAPKPMNTFIAFLVGDWQSGKGTQAVLQEHWQAVGTLVLPLVTPIKKAVKKTAAKPVKKTKTKPAKAKKK
jgi:ParB-like chromosome segregation protein Spo0J